MVINMRVSLLMERQMERVSTLGRMGRYMMASGKWVLKRGTEYGKEFMEILILENGKAQKLMGMVSTHGRMETDTKENGNNASSMAMVLTFLQTAMSSQDTILMVNQMVSASTSGITVQPMSENLKTV